MDSSHVSLILVKLSAVGFQKYCCKRNVVLGINFSTLSAILKCAENDDSVTLKASNDSDVMCLQFFNKLKQLSEYEVKLMNIDNVYLEIPVSWFCAIIKMSSSTLQSICKDLSQISDSVTIQCDVECVKFTSKGDIGSGAITICANDNVELKIEKQI
ncbi:proliferating cell nuclear antigen-like protein, partial [Leptotrombidium deliense]